MDGLFTLSGLRAKWPPQERTILCSSSAQIPLVLLQWQTGCQEFNKRGTISTDPPSIYPVAEECHEGAISLTAATTTFRMQKWSHERKSSTIILLPVASYISSGDGKGFGCLLKWNATHTLVEDIIARVTTLTAKFVTALQIKRLDSCRRRQRRWQLLKLGGTRVAGRYIVYSLTWLESIKGAEIGNWELLGRIMYRGLAE